MDINQAKYIVESKIRRKGFEIIYRKSMSGCVFEKSKKCFMPEIKTRKSLYIACHELYHVLREKKNEKVYINEMKAEKFAHRFLRHLGFAVPRSQTQRAKRYVLRKIRKAQNRGLKKVNSEVKKWL